MAGGWVRDKILGLQSADVDVALDRTSGTEFANLVSSYLTDLEERGDIPKPPKKRRRKVCVIPPNPSHFKHLETATVRILDHDVDFSNLRPPPPPSSSATDADADTSTSPGGPPGEDIGGIREEGGQKNKKQEEKRRRRFGTPLEDALQRDFTVNSLFYNVRTSAIEDWTGRGITDLLDDAIIRTPLDPISTLRDDPLRAFRAVRFAARFGMTVDDDVLSCVRGDRGVRDSLTLRLDEDDDRDVHVDGGGGGAGGGGVRRERVGKEVEGIIGGRGADPPVSLTIMIDTGLASLAFPFPPRGPRRRSGGDRSADPFLPPPRRSSFAAI